MTPERWAQIEELFHRAAECDPEYRTSLLNQICSDDPELRREVEVLLSCQGSAGNHLEATVQSEVDSLGFALAGATVSHYRILDGLGIGGMGLVYRAEDIRLGRRVALKFLPEESTKDPVALARFEREARAVSAVEHPNICPIYEFGEHEGRPFLVMQLLEGQTLRELLEKRKLERSKSDSRVRLRGGLPLTLDQVVDLSVQIADGLQAAHKKGIIHRDIKPANIFVTSQGQAKILDFGLAKLAHAGTAADEMEHQPRDGGANRKRSETESLATPDPYLSRTGVAMGTAGYMSPEQARGEKLDARTDVFSFGLVLYEMATGQAAFSGATGPELCDAILKQQPLPAGQVNPQLPAELERIVNKALEKNREARYQNASEMRAELEVLKGKIDPRRLRQRWILTSATVVILLVAAAIFWLARRQPSSTQVLPHIKFKQLTINSSDSPVTSGSVSPDGKYLAYIDTFGMHVKDIETGATQAIPSQEDSKNVNWSWEIINDGWFPDSTRFLVNAHPASEAPDALSSRTTSIWVLSRLGGVPHKIRDHAIAWSVSPDGSLISFGTNTGRLGEREIWLMEPNGGNAHKLFDTDENSSIGGTWWSPDGQRGLFFQTDASGDTMLSRDLKGGPSVTVFTPAELKQIRGDVAWLPDGRLIYQIGDPGSGFTSVQDTCNFWAMRLDAVSGRPIEKPRRLTNWTGFCIENANVTADGKRLAFLASSGNHGTSYIADFAMDGTRIFNRRHFTLEESDDFITDWADNNTVIVGKNRGDHYELYRQRLDQDTPEPIVTTAPGVVESTVVSPNGKWVMVQVWPASNNPAKLVPIVRVPLTGGSPEELFRVHEGSLISCSKAPSNLCAVAEQSDDKKEMIVTTLDPIKGRGQELARFAIDPNMDISHYLQGRVSPDGAYLLALRGAKGPIEIRSLSGGRSRIIQPVNVENLLVVGWAADGNGFFATNRTKYGSEILHVDLQGNTRFLYKSSSKSYVGACGGVPSPDGRHLAIYDLQQSANMWMMESF